MFPLPVFALLLVLPTIPAQQGPADCTFETGLCSLSQGTDDELDWERRQGATKFYKTLPSRDHTTGTLSGHYLAVRSPVLPLYARTARLETPVMPGGRKCLTFYYRMDAGFMGDADRNTMNGLNVYVMYENVLGDPVWSIMDGDLWTRAQITIAAPRDFQILFEGTVKSQFEGSVAIDDISLAEGACDEDCKNSFYGCCPDEVTAAAGPNYQGCRQTLALEADGGLDQARFEELYVRSSDSADCDFETDLCEWLQAGDNNMDFTRVRGQARTLQNTLPVADHTTGTGSGWYLTVESPIEPFYAQAARLSTRRLGAWGGEGEMCLSFSYHMSEKIPGYFPEKFPGSTNALSVYVTPDGELGEPLFTGSDIMEGGDWREVRVTIPAEGEFRIVFEALILSQYTGDISLDDVMLDAGPCEDLVHPCQKSRFGCCSDGRTRARGPSGEGCQRLQTEVRTVPKVTVSDCTLELGDRFGACWKTYQSTTYALRKSGKMSDVPAFCAAHKTLYTCYYDNVDSLCADDPDFGNFKAKLRDDVGGVNRNCRLGRNGVRRGRRAVQTPEEVMRMLR
ncbi:PREDICTED: MAM and LDL-receptor class A domain-containing protein 2-like [Branchiostoma belcheri]|uniref:MAM and LDL-receptor class A domain-containing protein 2-like n=1 Tax=Branchiostoma belcheri TaxID=7741 RepID=A0A6P4YVI9_BRABE|nr:PREDICTED: MAM and LDL-receptor class A domain-containing protein 2-like [Branchiostoma belcheri]